MEALLNHRARDYFQVKREQFNKKRAIRMTAKLYNYSMAEVSRASYYW